MVFYYVRLVLDHLNEEELVELINSVLKYPSFILAREYIQKAKEYKTNRKIKDMIKKFLIKIYAFI